MIILVNNFLNINLHWEKNMKVRKSILRTILNYNILIVLYQFIIKEKVGIN